MLRKIKQYITSYLKREPQSNAASYNSIGHVLGVIKRQLTSYTHQNNPKRIKVCKKGVIPTTRDDYVHTQRKEYSARR